MVRFGGGGGGEGLPTIKKYDVIPIERDIQEGVRDMTNLSSPGNHAILTSNRLSLLLDVSRPDFMASSTFLIESSISVIHSTNSL